MRHNWKNPPGWPLRWKHSGTATEPCYSLFKSVKIVLHGFNIFAVKSLSLIRRDQQMNDSFSYVEPFFMTHWWIRRWFGVMVRSFSKKKHDFFRIITLNSPMSGTKMTHIRKWVIHLLISANQRRAFNMCHLSKKNIKTMQYIFSLIRISWRICASVAVPELPK